MGSTGLNYAGLIEISLKIVEKLRRKEIEWDERQMPRTPHPQKKSQRTLRYNDMRKGRGRSMKPPRGRLSLDWVGDMIIGVEKRV